MSEILMDARNAGLAEIKTILEDQRARRLDVVASAGAISAVDGNLVVDGTEQVITDDGVTTAAGSYRPTDTCDNGLAAKLGIPREYLKTLRAERPDLYDANVNGMLHGGPSALAPAPDFMFPGAGGKFLVRLLRGDDAQAGVARAFLSPKYKIMDNLDVLLAVLQGVRDTGTDAVVGTCDLSDRRMFVRIEAPSVAAMAPRLLERYRSPFDGPGGVARAGDPDGMRLRSEYGNWDAPAAFLAAAREGQGYLPGAEPVVWAGFIVSNSDVGSGARTIAPQIRVRVCKNGLTLIGEADRKVHLGAEMDEGLIEWSAETVDAELDLIRHQTIDAVRRYLSPEFLAESVAKVEALAGTPLGSPERTVKEVCKAAGFTQAEGDGIFAHFLTGGQGTAGGLVNALTSYTQTIASPDRADRMERRSMAVLEHAARIGARG